MQMAHVFALFLSVASVQFIPGDAAPQAQDAQYQDFCDVTPAGKMKFLQCIQDNIPALKELLAKSGQSAQELLNSVCSENEGDNPEELTEDVARDWPVIERCLAGIE
uniref:Putative secreted protein n=1 Tax=Amblyomma americanum TaxID=6943 RepID=A0A0C9RVZ1_AMBAM